MSEDVEFRVETKGEAGYWIIWDSCMTQDLGEARLDELVKDIQRGRFSGLLEARLVKVTETTEVCKGWVKQ